MFFGRKLDKKFNFSKFSAKKWILGCSLTHYGPSLSQKYVEIQFLISDFKWPQNGQKRSKWAETKTEMQQIFRWSFLNLEIFSYLQQKRRYDVMSGTWYLRPHMMPVALNGLNRIFKIQFCLKFNVFRAEIGQKV